MVLEVSPIWDSVVEELAVFTSTTDFFDSVREFSGDSVVVEVGSVALGFVSHIFPIINLVSQGTT